MSIHSMSARYDKLLDLFVFDIEDDNKTDIIQLHNVEYNVPIFNHCYYYGYHVGDGISSARIKGFIHNINIQNSIISETDKKPLLLTQSISLILIFTCLFAILN